MQVISTLSELDSKIAECNNLLTTQSDDAMREMFNNFRMDFSAEAPGDPFSPEYRNYQIALYERISGRTYALQNERTVFDVAAYLHRPFPYYLKSTLTAGQHTIALGFMLRALNLPPGARVIEFGPGWGNSTMAMALSGLQVTAVDIEPNFCEVLRARAAQNFVDVDVVQADFFWAETVTEPYDAAIFFECFHHCDDHMRLLAALGTALKPDGQIYFASEPILPDYAIPWGVRMDGEALWAMRHFGWLELGYDEAYFHAALERAGWSATKHACPDPFWATVWQARRSEAGPLAAPSEPASHVLASIPPGATAGPATPAPKSSAALAGELEAVYRSTSWRATAPLRQLKRWLSPSERDPPKTVR